MKITAIILTKDEERSIERCLGSISFCNEIIVVDDYSTDKTIEIVHKVLKAHKLYKVLKRDLKGDFAGQRNFAMRQATSEWILFIDADEEVTTELKEEIQSVVSSQLSVESVNSFYIKRRDHWWGRDLKFGETQKIRNRGIVRLVRKNSGKWMGNVHEVFYTAKSIGTLDGFLNHYPHPTVKEFIQDINTYSSLRAHELYNHGSTTNILQIIFFPFFKFILNYFIYLGFLDGAAGFIYAFFMSFHSFLVRAKLYQLKYKYAN